MTTTAEAGLTIENLNCRYVRPGIFSHRKSRTPAAVDDISLTVVDGETLALVGESGSGKSTIARAVAGLLPPVSGRMNLAGRDLPASVERRPAELRRLIQIIFQNPDASLNRRQRIGTILGRPLRLFFGLSGTKLESEIRSLLAAVQLPPDYAERFPGEISGGERQRVAIARALAARPALLLCDEIVSALDVSVQSAVLELLRGLQRQSRLSMLFITHDLAVVRWFADRVAVLYRGRLCEVSPVERIFTPPFHPYTALLVEAAPSLGRPAAAGLAQPASPAAISIQPGACAFAGLCRHRIDGLCEKMAPPWRQLAQGHAIRCHLEPSALNAITVRGGNAGHSPTLLKSASSR